MTLQLILYLAVSLNLLGHFLYMGSIIKGEAKPNLVTWFFWTLAPFIGFFFQLKAGATISTLPIFIAGFGSLLIMLTALFTRNGYWKISPFDIYCGAFSFMALILYIFTHNLGISVFFAVASDALAAVPTFIKTWKFPETEMWGPYVFPIFSNTVGLLLVADWSFAVYSFGAYFLVLDFAMIFTIYRKKIASLIQYSHVK